MRKKASICSSDRPLVSGTQQPVKARFTEHTAAKKKKGTCRPKAFWGRRGAPGHRGTLKVLPPQHQLRGPASSSQPGGQAFISFPCLDHPRVPQCPQREIQVPQQGIRVPEGCRQPSSVLGPGRTSPSWSPPCPRHRPLSLVPVPTSHFQLSHACLQQACPHSVADLLWAPPTLP